MGPLNKDSNFSNSSQSDSMSKRKDKNDDDSPETTKTPSPESDTAEKDEKPKSKKRKQDSSERMRETNESLRIANNGIKRNIIYLDPPWEYKGGARSGSAENHYSTMSAKDLRELCVDEIAADDCLLLMWITGTQADVALDLIKAWKFKFVSISWAVWVKCDQDGVPSRHQTGIHTRQQAEFILIAKRGKTKRFMKLDVPWIGNVVLEKREEHSKKPDVFKEMISKLYEDVPRIELFARQSEDLKWDYWGNETDKFGSAKRDEEAVAKIREVQIKKAEMCQKCVRNNVKQIDHHNKFGLERNGQNSMLKYLKK